MDDMLIAMAVAILLATIKNPARRAKLKAAMLKVRNQINQAYAADPDFQDKGKKDKPKKGTK